MKPFTVLMTLQSAVTTAHMSKAYCMPLFMFLGILSRAKNRNGDGMQVPDKLKEAMTFVLSGFEKLDGMCLGGSVALSTRLDELGVLNHVALGTLRCAGVTAFEYSKPNIPKTKDGNFNWDGHAWCVVEDEWIADVTLIRTARALPVGSNLKRHFLPILNRGAIIVRRKGEISFSEELEYRECSKLPKSTYEGLLAGVMRHNGLH